MTAKKSPLFEGAESVNISAALACDAVVKAVVALHALPAVLHLLLAGFTETSFGHVLLQAPKNAALPCIENNQSAQKSHCGTSLE